MFWLVKVSGLFELRKAKRAMSNRHLFSYSISETQSSISLLHLKGFQFPWWISNDVGCVDLQKRSVWLDNDGSQNRHYRDPKTSPHCKCTHTLHQGTTQEHDVMGWRVSQCCAEYCLVCEALCDWGRAWLISRIASNKVKRAGCKPCLILVTDIYT